MKSSSHSSFPPHRALVAAGMGVLLGTAVAVAQTNTGTPGTTRGSAAQNTDSTSGTYDSRKSTTGSTGQTDISGSAGTTATGSTQSGTSSTSATGSSTTSSTDTAGGATTMTGRDSAKLGWMERRWVNKVADSGMTEIALAKLATEKASNPEVKSFAQKLVDDHTKVSDELKSIASQKNVKLDDEDLGSDRAHKRLSKKSGTEFDQEFIEHMVDMHEADVKLFEKASTDAKDPALKSFAAKHVDHLRQHLQQAQSLRSTIVPTGRTNDSASTTSTGTTDATSTSTPQSTTSDTATSSSTAPASTDSSSTTGSSSDTTRRNNSR